MLSGLRRAMLRAALLAGVAALSVSAAAQERPAKRIANIVGVAMEEYSKAIGPNGAMISDVEYGETVEFLNNARELSTRLSGDRAGETRALIDSLIAAVEAKVPPQTLAGLRDRFSQSLGADAALDLPTRMVDIASGQQLYEARCASCHGATGQGDGPAARGMNPAPPALGSAASMRDVTPALMFRIVTVGIGGTPMAAFGTELSADQRWDVIAYLLSLHHPREHVAQGEGIFALECSGCHGVSGLGDGPLARELTKLPPEIGTFAWQAERSDAQLAEAIKNGVAGTAMPPNRSLHDADIESAVAHLRQLALRDVPARAAGVAAQRDPEAVLRQVRRTLDEALAAARAGRGSDASDRAFDAYLAFEPIETPARAKNPGLVASVERQFADFRGAISANDVRTAERVRHSIETSLPGVADLMRPTGGSWGAFMQSLLIILREGLEAILVIGAIVAFLIKTGHRERLRSIWLGTGFALVASAVTAVIFATVLRALPASREIIEGVTMLLAVAVLFSVSYWLISKVEAAKWQQFIREKVTAALQHGGGTALAFVAFLAVYREGAETALFYQALFTEGGNFLPITLGIVVGAAILTVIFVLFHKYGVRIPLRPFFAVTSALLYYMAFVFMGKGIRELQEGGAVSITTVPGLPHVDPMGIYPTIETLGAQLILVLLFAFALLKTFWPKRSVALPTVPLPTEPPPDQAVKGDLASALQRMEVLEARIKQLEKELTVEPKT
jgi:high-affinity iron transporter